MLIFFLGNGYSLTCWLNWILGHNKGHTKHGRRCEKKQKQNMYLAFGFILNPVLPARQLCLYTGQSWRRACEWKHYFVVAVVVLLLPQWFLEVILGICAHICLMHLRVLHIEPALNKGVAGPQFTSTRLGWPSCSCSQGWLLFRRWCCSADTQLFWRQFKSLSHSDVLHRAGLWLKACPEPPEMDRMISTVLQWTPSKSRNFPHLTFLPWDRDSNLFLTQYPSCSTQ